MHELVLFVYKEIIPDFPNSKKFESLSQIKRAAYSIPLNIVEGCGRASDKDFAHFLDVALGSHGLGYCALLILHLGFIDQLKYDHFEQQSE